jgi:hypothetical protein
MHRCRRLTLPVALIVSMAAVSGPVAAAGGRVELELVTGQRVPVTAQQQWLRLLAQAGVSNLRIRAQRPSDATRIDVRGTETAAVYVVTGLITSSNEVVVPGERFKPTEAARLARWLDDLARLGPPQQRPVKSAFGLTATELEQVHEDLARPLGFSSQGVSRAEVVEGITRRLRLPLRSAAPAVLAIADDKDDKLVEELSSLTCGTALAYVLRPLGLCLVPRESAQGGPEYAIVQAAANLEAWPVGFEPGRPKPDILPTMYESLNVNIEGVTVAKVLEAVGARLKVPILPDYNAMARHGIDPEKVFVSLPRGRMTYSLVLRRVLSQARLKSELRVDEAGTPLLWITTVKPI